jgi:putative membrane protein
MTFEVNDMWYWHGMGGWGWLMMLVFWAVAFFLIVWTVRSTTASGLRDGDVPRRILDERMARGEIDLADYEERRRVLESHR